jgi:PAS domain S-box-containing protein
MTATIRVLHVDDEPGFGELARDLLTREDDGLDVRTETSASDALDRLADERFDCVVSDYQMPGMDGLEFFEAVRAEYPDLPFILFTGKGSEEIAAEAVAAGVTDYLQKGSGTEQYAILANRIRNATERYAAEREVRETRERFQALLSDAADYIHVIDADGTVQYTTPSVEHVLGYEPATLRDRDALGRVHPEDRERAAAKLDAVADDPDGEASVEVRVRHRDGSWRWLAVKMRNLLADPTVEGVVANVRDVTERRERAAAVDWHKRIIQQMGEGVYVLDSDHEFRFVDYRAEDVDLSPADWEGRPVDCLTEAGVFDADAVADIRTALEDLFADRAEEVRLELEPNVPPSTEILELRLTPLSSVGDEVVLGTTRDVTAHKRRERELREAKERYRTLIETFPNGGVFAFDEDLQYTLAGGSGLAEVGLTSADMEGLTPFDLFPEAIAEETARNYRATLRGESTTYEQAYDGKHYHVWTVPLHDEDGRVTGGMAVSQDVTEREERERELERQNERLEEFASVVSHDLRNPLTVLRTSLDLAESTDDPEHIDRCFRSVERMETLIDDLLALARQGEAIDTLEAVALAPLVEACWDTVDTGAATLTVEADVTVRADEARLRQLLENLLGNAATHAGPGAAVTVGLMDPIHTETRTEADTVGFYVADDGPGIPPDERGRVFDSGYSTTSEGTGFGLAIVQEIADAHGWDVTVTERRDGGAADEERESAARQRDRTGGARFEITGVHRD